MKIDQRFFPELGTSASGFTYANRLDDYTTYPVDLDVLNNSQVFGVQKGKYACTCYSNYVPVARTNYPADNFISGELQIEQRPFSQLRFFSVNSYFDSFQREFPIPHFDPNYVWRGRNINGYYRGNQQSLAYPVLGFGYNTFCFLIKIYCCNLELIKSTYSDTPNSHVFSYYLDDYFEKYTETYPDIIGVEIIPYYPYRRNFLPRSLNDFGRGLNTYNQFTDWETNGIKYFYVSDSLNWETKNTGKWRSYSATCEMMIGTRYIYQPTSAGINTICHSFGSPSFVYPVRIPDLTYTIPDGGGQQLESIAWKITATKEDILHMVACHGCFFTGDEETAQTGENNSDKMYLGLFEKDGTLTGRYSQGTENEKQINYNWTGTDAYEFNGYTGSIDPNVYTSEIELNEPKISTIDVFNRSFAMNETQINQLADFLWNADESIFSEIIKGLALLGDNPLNGVIDLRLFPFDIQLKNNATDLIDIKIGRTNTGVQGYRLDSKVSSVIDLGYCTFYPVFGNFLDYSPYTTATLMIPYCGSIIVDTKDFMGHRISCKLIVDYNTGGCCACVFKDDIPYTFVNGVCAVSIPVSGSNSAQFAQNFIGGIVNGATQIAQGLGEVSAGKTTGTGRMATGVLEIAKPIYNHPTQYQLSGSATPSTAFFQPQNCYFVISRPVTNIPNDYGHTTGFACELTTQLSAMTGYTVCENVDVTIPTTTEEQKLIKQLLESGVYL